MSYLDHFKKHTVVVCDTGDFESKQFTLPRIFDIVRIKKAFFFS
jgi:hypothetical protein